MSSQIKLAVIGAGHLGRIHAKLVQQLPDVHLLAVCDPSVEARDRVVSDFGCLTLADYRSLVGEMDAAIVAAPTSLHFDICSELLKAGVHCLVEKPITPTADTARTLVDLAADQNCVLQVGHVERFNPAVRHIESTIGQPYYIDAQRTGPFTFRSTDVGVVMDLMIHDIDLTLSLVRSEVIDVRAIGVSVFGEHEDIAQARLEFENGTVANLTASRASYQASRTMQVFSDQGFARLDMTKGEVTTISPDEALAKRQINFSEYTEQDKANFRDELFTKWLAKRDETVESCNAILEEQKDFVQCIQRYQKPRVTGWDGMKAVSVAERIVADIQGHQWGVGSRAQNGSQVRPEDLQHTELNVWRADSAAAEHSRPAATSTPSDQEQRKAG